MKFLSRLKLAAVLVTAGLLLTLVTAPAQQVSGPVVKSALSNAATWTVFGSNGATVAQNIPALQGRWVPVGANGFAVAIKAYATNAALTTNVWFTLEFTADGVNAITNNNVSVVYLPTGVATNTYFTNFYTPTDALRGNVAAVRIKNVMQTNGLPSGAAPLAGNLFVEKFQILSR